MLKMLASTIRILLQLIYFSSTLGIKEFFKLVKSLMFVDCVVYFLAVHYGEGCEFLEFYLYAKMFSRFFFEAIIMTYSYYVLSGLNSSNSETNFMFEKAGKVSFKL